MALAPVSDWSRSFIRARVEAAMTYTVQILRGQLGTLDPSTGLVGGLSDDSEIYNGIARVRTIGSSGTVNIGGAEVAVRTVVVSIPITAPVPHVDDLLKVLTDGQSDTDADTRIFRIVGVDGGSLFGDARRMTCSGWYNSRYWGAT